jgi:hypothetical protein
LPLLTRMFLLEPFRGVMQKPRTYDFFRFVSGTPTARSARWGSARWQQDGGQKSEHMCRSGLTRNPEHGFKGRCRVAMYGNAPRIDFLSVYSPLTTSGARSENPGLRQTPLPEFRTTELVCRWSSASMRHHPQSRREDHSRSLRLLAHSQSITRSGGDSTGPWSRETTTLELGPKSALALSSAAETLYIPC